MEGKYIVTSLPVNLGGTVRQGWICLDGEHSFSPLTILLYVDFLKVSLKMSHSPKKFQIFFVTTSKMGCFHRPTVRRGSFPAEGVKKYAAQTSGPRECVQAGRRR